MSCVALASTASSSEKSPLSISSSRVRNDEFYSVINVVDISHEAVDPNENLLSVRVFGNGRWQTMKLEHVAAGHYRFFMDERVAGVYGIKVKYEGVLVCNQKTQFFERTILLTKCTPSLASDTRQELIAH